MPRAQLSYSQYMYPELATTEDEINNYRLHACNQEYHFIIILITVPHYPIWAPENDFPPWGKDKPVQTGKHASLCSFFPSVFVRHWRTSSSACFPWYSTILVLKGISQNLLRWTVYATMKFKNQVDYPKWFAGLFVTTREVIKQQ